MLWPQGYVQVYTGPGKGKTTAALGLALRAAGAGLAVFFAQFAKSGEYSEIKALARFADLITVRQYGTGHFVRGRPSAEEIKAAREGFAEVKEIVRAQKHPVVILDEANVAIKFGLISLENVLELIKEKPTPVELVLTGRWAPEELIQAADLVTYMEAVKHYYQAGVRARIGIEK
ncbi:cob(I)yrinic acid a,c-diamide adenosyltransferase [Thermosulfuriphilus ammonigenes]|uniref:corrinoid adenosyltransferase n=1 Tax=Thermosulfuriphilus ammonigenes TaxID=1936021 RepID=A0A6G7PXL9_9BACT|nr:cob(I)yrinic acid a,c-diamide adenosyltransferase [Thermosulfuriphilus ammonigenes]MBA2849756.1 cob(I)alamin adenosyltransferase [Thermosulfuriphilus ammonigenes]QIJ72153.1 cob(I)yrinic acid a,c-diamide adenosyltransferase [Thermosulfuriphilus ammonigenes]